MVEMSKKYFEILEMSKNDSKLSYDSQKSVKMSKNDLGKMSKCQIFFEKQTFL